MDRTLDPRINPHLPHSDEIVLQNLFHDIRDNPESCSEKVPERDQATIELLQSLTNPKDPAFEPTIFTTYDEGDIPEWIKYYILQLYSQIAVTIVRHPTDVVFLTHLLWYFFTIVPSAAYLYHNFTYLHGIVHAVHSVWCAGSFTLLLHNHIHNNGILAKSWKWLDLFFPYVLEPLMGHTWDSYYYHHVKHHHVESNGPDDLSTTIRYQRDELLHFLHYEFRFMFFIWLELPLYFLRRKQPVLAFRAFASEMVSYAFLYYMTFHVNARASVFALWIPFALLRTVLMLGNWGQHALVDECEPDSDLRSSITLIDVQSNRYCFNDGWHTAHHLNPRRHWREHPVHFMREKKRYAEGRALIFRDIDFVVMTIKLLSKDYVHLAERLVPIGDQVGMSQDEIVEMLRKKTRKFSDEEIKQKFRQKAASR